MKDTVYARWMAQRMQNELITLSSTGMTGVSGGHPTSQVGNLIPRVQSVT